MKTEISPSVLDSNFAEIKDTLKVLESSGIKYVHFDVMDGNFVPNLTFGAKIIKPLRPLTKLVFDTHLMIKNPEKYAADFLSAGADILTIHIEATSKVKQIIDQVHSAGKKAGISIKPGTPVSKIKKWLPMTDLVLVMSVEPGFGGQKFMPDALKKVSELRAIIDKKKYNCILEIDGGVNASLVPEVCAAGVDLFVAGSAVFGGGNPAEAIKKLQEAINSCK
jgi:ribulose-phosphate 3-epimerase